MSIDKQIQNMESNILEGLVWACKNNTGNEPSLSCYHHALDQAEKFLAFKEALKQGVSGENQ